MTSRRHFESFWTIKTNSPIQVCFVFGVPEMFEIRSIVQCSLQNQVHPDGPAADTVHDAVSGQGQPHPTLSLSLSVV